MSKIPQTKYEEVSQEAQELWDQQIRAHGRMTNMKRTMAHSADTLRAYMEWYPLRDKVIETIGERATIWFAHAISSETDCLICSTFFRKILIEWGDDPDNPQLTAEEQQLVDLGRAMVTNSNNVDQQLIQQLKEKYGDAFVIDLVGFGGQMYATNLFNNVLQIDLDDYLEGFRKTN